MIHTGDCVEVMASLDADSIDAIVTDPPYGLEFMGKEWDRLDGTMTGHIEWGASSSITRRNSYQDLPRQQDWHQKWATEALRVAKPGAYLLAFGGTRTVHRLTVALEDAGWIIRDLLVWAYASGFPKSKASLKPAWEPIVLARKPGPLQELAIDACRLPTTDSYSYPNGPRGNTFTVAADPDGTRLEPVESHPEGRWPANLVLTDPIFDGDTEGVVGGGETKGGAFPGPHEREDRTQYRIGGLQEPRQMDDGTYSRFFQLPGGQGCSLCGRARSAVTSSGQSNEPDASAPSDAATSPASAQASSPARSKAATSPETDTTTTTPARWTCVTCVEAITSGSIYGGTPLRAFLVPKASRSDREPVVPGDLELGMPDNAIDRASQRNGEEGSSGRGSRSGPRRNTHPTVKPTELMRHLVRLVTPQNGTVLDPFLGSGTTALAAEAEGFEWVGIERESEYVKIAEQRLVATQRGLGL